MTLTRLQAVVRGAALQAAISSPAFRVREFTIIDKTQYGIDLSWKAQASGLLLRRPVALGPFTASDENSNAPVYTENSPTQLSKMLTFYRDAAFELDAKYSAPARVPDNEELLSKFLVDPPDPRHGTGSSHHRLKALLPEPMARRKRSRSSCDSTSLVRPRMVAVLARHCVRSFHLRLRPTCGDAAGRGGAAGSCAHTVGGCCPS